MNGSLRITTPSDTEIAMSRVFNAPRHLVFEAWTKPELVKRWLGVWRTWTMDECEIDLRVGGSYRYLWRNAADGMEMGMGGIFREIVPGERIVATEKFDQAWYEGDAVGTVTFSEENGQTTLLQVMKYASKQVRDAVLETPMEQGVNVSYDNLENLLATVAA